MTPMMTVAALVALNVVGPSLMGVGTAGMAVSIQVRGGNVLNNAAKVTLATAIVFAAITACYATPLLPLAAPLSWTAGAGIFTLTCIIDLLISQEVSDTLEDKKWFRNLFKSN